MMEYVAFKLRDVLTPMERGDGTRESIGPQSEEDRKS